MNIGKELSENPKAGINSDEILCAVERGKGVTGLLLTQFKEKGSLTADRDEIEGALWSIVRDLEIIEEMTREAAAWQFGLMMEAHQQEKEATA